MPKTVTLDHGERLLVTQAGIIRRLHHIRRDTEDRWLKPRYGYFDTDIMAAGAEYVVAREMNAFWHAITDDNPRKLPGDCGIYQVRATEHKNGRLLLHPEDDPKALFFFVTGEIPTFTIHGSMLASDGFDPIFWDETMPTPCYAVPQPGRGSPMEPYPRKT